jgi:putative transposase
MDHTQIDLLVKDLRDEPYRTESGETRPYLIIILESRSRRILAWVLSYDRPNKYDIAAAIAMALRNGGIPDEIWTDQGKEMMAGHVEKLADGLGFKLVHLEKHQPQQKGRVERFFGTLNTRLWATLEGYVASNTPAKA